MSLKGLVVWSSFYAIFMRFKIIYETIARLRKGVVFVENDWNDRLYTTHLLFLFYYGLILNGGKSGMHNEQNKSSFLVVEVSLVLFTSGPDLFQDLFTEIEQAKKHVHILFYIIKNDSFSQQFLKALSTKSTKWGGSSFTS